MKTSTAKRRFLLAAGLLVSGAGAALSPPETPGVPPGWSDEAQKSFLLTAEVVDMETLPVGVTGSRRVTLTDGKRRHDAHFQSIDIFRRQVLLESRRYLNFRDSYKYNIAAYRLDRLLDLGMVPVTVERSIQGERGALSWWIDDVKMMENERRERGLSPPDSEAWDYQIYRFHTFAQLIFDTDPDQTNQLITDDWKVWLIDFTRAFRTFKTLPKTPALVKIDRPLLEKLQGLDESTLLRELQPYLTKVEIRSILARRDEIVRFFSADAWRVLPGPPQGTRQ